MSERPQDNSHHAVFRFFAEGRCVEVFGSTLRHRLLQATDRPDTAAIDWTAGFMAGNALR